jgi:PAS domain S-box-containing protein
MSVAAITYYLAIFLQDVQVFEQQELAYKIGLFLLLLIVSILGFKNIVDARKVLELKDELRVYERTLSAQGQRITKQKDEFNSVTRNVNEVVKSELASLKKSENELLVALNTANLGFWEWNTKTDHMQFNQNFYAMLGYSPGDLKPTTASFVEHIHPDDRYIVAEKMQSSIRELKNFELNFRMRNVEDRFRWMLCRGKIATIDSKNEAVRVIGILLDIHEIHQKETKILDQSIQLNKSFKQLEMAHSELKIKSERIREYSFMMSHKVRKPLANILGLLQLAQDDDLNMELDLDMVSTAANEMDDMIQEMHRVLGSHIDQMGTDIPIIRDEELTKKKTPEQTKNS